MKLSALTNNTIRVRDLIGEAKGHLSSARTHLDLVMWIAPNGDFYIEPRSVMIEIIETSSWR